MTDPSRAPVRRVITGGDVMLADGLMRADVVLDRDRIVAIGRQVRQEGTASRTQPARSCSQARSTSTRISRAHPTAS